MEFVTLMNNDMPDINRHVKYDAFSYEVVSALKYCIALVTHVHFLPVSAVKLAPSSFEDPALYLGLNEDGLVQYFVDFLAGNTNNQPIAMRVRSISCDVAFIINSTRTSIYDCTVFLPDRRT